MSQSFTQYMMDFYGPDSEIYPELGFNELQINIATAIYKMRLDAKGEEFVGDTVDRENVRDIVLEARRSVLPEFSKV